LLEGKGHTGVPAIAQPTRTFRNLNIPVPSLPEQHAIAEALSDVDVLIDTLDRLIAKKRDLKQAAMQQLLTGLTRLPGFYGDWEVKRLGNIATCFSGGTPATEVAAYYGGDIPWITSGDLNKEYITDVAGRISQAGLMNSAAQMVEANTLLIALYGATSGVTAISRIRAAINQAVLAIVPHQDDTSFLYFRLRLLKDWLISTYTQGGQPNLSGNIIKSVELSLPPLPEQTAIATVLGELDSELAELEQRREKILAVKLGMMQELLTGRTRLV
jgi:type I restriction enzyme S subunit